MARSPAPSQKSRLPRVSPGWARWGGIVVGGMCAFTGGLHAFLLPVVSSLFFSNATTWQAQLRTYIMMSASFVLYPLGSFVFGVVGDRHGRQTALRLCVSLILLSACLVGFIPPASWGGSWSALILALCVAAHTFGGGGEFSGSALLSLENTLPRHQGITSGLLCVCAVVGIVSASALVAIVPVPAWRWGFWLCGGFWLIALWLIAPQSREKKPSGIVRSSTPRLISAPGALLLVLRTHLKALVVAFCWISMFAASYYFVFVFLHSFVPLIHNVPQNFMSRLNTGSLLAYMVGLGAAGTMANGCRERRVMVGGVVAVAIAVYPLLRVLLTSSDTFLLAGAQALLAVSVGVFIGPIHAATASLFPASVRYRCLALSSTLAFTLMGGTTPWVCMLIWRHTESAAALASWMWFACAVALIGFLVGAPDQRDHAERKERAQKACERPCT